MKKYCCLFFSLLFLLPVFLFGKVKKSSAQTVLSLEPAVIKGPVGNVFTLEVKITTAQKLVAADLDLSYDPALWEIQKISPGSFLANPQILTSRINSQEGKLLFSLFSTPGQSGNGNLATVQLKALKETNGPLKFGLDSTTILAAAGGEKISFTSSPASLETLSPGGSANASPAKISPAVSPTRPPLITPSPTETPATVSPLAKIIKPLGTLLVIAGIGLLILVLTVL
ncbi:MAG: Cohesin domain protein [Microgenomates group bacterium ADurb.Bin219]|nr:MAG: Cohesin domain protein [Microgenomates group bacterium ADurb.Bin219]HNP89508.1 cohesin domain-containing protein [Candidatus Woesebacteria bacterium]